MSTSSRLRPASWVEVGRRHRAGPRTDRGRVGLRALLGAAMALALVMGHTAAAAAQQTGTVEGTVAHAETGEAVAGAMVEVVGTGLGTITGSDGSYAIQNVPAGDHRVRVETLGFASRTEDVEVAAGATISVDFSLEPAVVDVEEIVAVGVTEATERARVPFSVGRAPQEIMEVSTPNVAQSLTGQVAGVSVVQGSGRPGEPPDILLRGSTSIDAAGRDQGPLIIVDGVITATDLRDIDSRDVENIEVVRGAAAASLYGSRAAQGVIEITTRSGRDVADGETRYSITQEFGVQELDGEFDLARRHYFEMNDAGTAFLEPDGTECGYPGMDPALPVCESFVPAGQRAAEGESPNLFNSFMTEDFPRVFDNVGQVFDPGNWLETHLAVQGRSGGTNYRVSYSYLDEDGVIDQLQGFQRHNFRARLNQQVTDNLSVSATAFVSRSDDDDVSEFQGNPLFQITRMPAGADITAPDPDNPDVPVRLPDPEEENENPLIDLMFVDRGQERSRTMAGADVNYTPVRWLSFDGNVSYDRLDWTFGEFRDVGFPSARPEVDNFDLGTIERQSSITEALNASANLTGRWTLWDDLDVRLQGRYLYEEEVTEGQSGDGLDLAARGIPTLDNLQDMDRVSLGSFRQSIRSEGLFAGLNLEYRDRYIFDGLFRRDGSSLFGADERWQNYFRTAVGYRLSEEEFFDFDNVDELTFRASVGTAGGRPTFAAQFETFNVGAGVVSPGTLGNRELRPEEATEYEVGVEALFRGRFSAEVTYAQTEVDDQIMRVPLPATAGFSQQWQNAGEIRSNTVEISLQGQLVERENWGWQARALFDRTRQWITRLDVPEFTQGVPGQAMGDIFFVREGERLGTFYGGILAESCSQLPADVRDYCDSHFDRNDDGLMVPVGEGNSWRDMGWGETVEIGGEEFDWGIPVEGVEIDPITGEETDFAPVGNTTPDFNVSFSSTLSYRNLSLYGLLDWVEGVDVWNQPLQWATFQHFSGIMDDAGRPEEEQKPVAYYDFLYQSFGLEPQSFWVQDASFLKLRELALRYRLGQDRLESVPGLSQVQDVALSITGRNLLTFTDYNGYDPEIGRSGGDVGSSALARVDGFQYPNFRTFTFGVEVNF